ncbi:acetamidase/formamidase family protein [Promicromonospora citrea]|uniref:Acetamidase n=1 Tax=Promicromonospora citrea TaxID=43677 RepID=A0A8H9GL26_9MICO|nr:acetamidase/formamidase family protein [Promicromonospora citrea]NNH50811.1 acetamidase [Promicromonospora citrea]GGM35800.1 acetamidase [Promicromonospora citrea]
MTGGEQRDGRTAAQTLVAALGRRSFLRAALGVGAGSALAAGAAPTAHAARGHRETARFTGVLQPGRGRIPGDTYLRSDVDDVLWGYVPSVHAAPVARVRSGRTVTIDSVSHEGILEDQGRDPVAYFAQHGVRRRDVLDDAVAIAAGYTRTARSFDVDGPHVVTGPVLVEGAEPGDVLKIETLAVTPRVPYGVVSSRHGKGALARTASGAPAGITLDEVMPPVGTDGRGSGIPTEYGNVSVFASVRGSQAVMGAGRARVRFPLRAFFGMMGVAFAESTDLTAPEANSIPPTLGGGNIDIRHLGAGSTFYLPVRAEGALFYVGDPHMAMGDGEVALTAMEGSLRGTFRLTVCKPRSGDAPSVAFRYPFGETADAWIPIGLSDPDGSVDGQLSDLDVAMRRAVVNALDFLEHDRGLDRAVAYAYLSAASDFAVSQVVDRTVGVHALIHKADLR